MTNQEELSELNARIEFRSVKIQEHQYDGARFNSHAVKIFGLKEDDGMMFFKDSENEELLYILIVSPETTQAIHLSKSGTSNDGSPRGLGFSARNVIRNLGLAKTRWELVAETVEGVV